MDDAHEAFWRLHGKDVGEDGKPMFLGVPELLREIDSLRRNLSETAEVLNWILDLHGKAGKLDNEPQEQEWYDALNSAERILSGDKYQGEEDGRE